jgi:hypothetical protein
VMVCPEEGIKHHVGETEYGDHHISSINIKLDKVDMDRNYQGFKMHAFTKWSYKSKTCDGGTDTMRKDIGTGTRIIKYVKGC